MSSRDDVTTLSEDPAALDDQDVEPTVPTDATEPEPPADAADVPADSPDDENAPDAQAEVQAEPEAVPTPWQPPDGGQPFAFRTDGREVEVPGALRYDHGIYIPTESWNHLQRFTADREALNQRYSQLEQRYQDRDPQSNAEVIQARETLKAFVGLLDQGPEKVAEWLDNYQLNRPLLEQQIQNRSLQAQLEARNTRYSEVEHQQMAETISQQLPGYLKQHIEAAVSALPELKELAGVTDKVFDELWKYADYLFVEATDRDMPELNLKRGQIGVHPTRLKAMLEKQAETRAELKRLEKAAAVNKAATSKPKAAPTVTTRGRPAPGDRTTTYTARDWKDQYLSGSSEE